VDSSRGCSTPTSLKSCRQFAHKGKT
jgi:hypothetical protein